MDTAVFTILAVVTTVSEIQILEFPRAEAQEVKPRPPIPDFNVTCVLEDTCTLPCPFSGEIREASWTRFDKPFIPIVVHPPLQTEHRGHHDYWDIAQMSLQRPGGDANLVISRVQIKHQGLHQCKVNPRKEDFNRFINLTVYTPITGVSLRPDGQELVCSSVGIYPKPNVTWTKNPGPAPGPQPSINRSETGLFSVLSSVPLTQHAPVEYRCTVSTKHSRRSATYRGNAVISLSEKVIVPCAEPRTPVKSLVWRFNRSNIIYNRTGLEQVFGEFWTQFVDGLTESNSLILKDLTQDQQGLFSCELSTDYKTYFTETEVMDTKPDTQGTESESDRDVVRRVVGGVLGGVLGLIISAVIYWVLCRCMKPVGNERKNSEDRADTDQASGGQQVLMQALTKPTVDGSDEESDYDSEFTDSRRGSQSIAETSGYEGSTYSIPGETVHTE